MYSPVRALAVLPQLDGRDLLVVGSATGLLWRAETRDWYRNDVVTRPVTALAVVPRLNGRVLLAVGGEDGTLELIAVAVAVRKGRWSLEENVVESADVARIRLPGAIRALAASSSPGWLAVSGDGGTALVRVSA
jgi:hypothetical protein